MRDERIVMRAIWKLKPHPTLPMEFCRNMLKRNKEVPAIPSWWTVVIS